jgi:hypothetical protein
MEAARLETRGSIGSDASSAWSLQPTLPQGSGLRPSVRFAPPPPKAVVRAGQQTALRTAYPQPGPSALGGAHPSERTTPAVGQLRRSALGTLALALVRDVLEAAGLEVSGAVRARTDLALKVVDSERKVVQ